jgi:hypothetical protein
MGADIVHSFDQCYDAQCSQLTLYQCFFLHLRTHSLYSQKQPQGRSTNRSLRSKGVSPLHMSSSSATGTASSLASPVRALQATGGMVQGGGGGSAKLYYAAGVMSAAGKTATAEQSGSGTVMGMGFGTISGPDGMASAGGRGGGNISGGFALSAFNGAFGNAIGGGQVGGFGGGSGQFVPGMNAQAIMNANKTQPPIPTDVFGNPTGPAPTLGFSGSTGGGGGAIAFAQGLGAANITAAGAGQFGAANATGVTTAFGIGYGQGSNSDGVAGGNAVSQANAVGGGAATAGEAPTGLTPAGNGGLTQFLGFASSSATNVGGGYFGGDPKTPTPYFPAFVIPALPTGGFFTNP